MSGSFDRLSDKDEDTASFKIRLVNPELLPYEAHGTSCSTDQALPSPHQLVVFFPVASEDPIWFHRQLESLEQAREREGGWVAEGRTGPTAQLSLYGPSSSLDNQPAK